MPAQIEFNQDQSKQINYFYDVAGIKLRKTTPEKTTDYLGNFVYENDKLQYILFSEGRITFNNQSTISNYQYNITDHYATPYCLDKLK